MRRALPALFGLAAVLTLAGCEIGGVTVFQSLGGALNLALNTLTLALIGAVVYQYRLLRKPPPSDMAAALVGFVDDHTLAVYIATGDGTSPSDVYDASRAGLPMRELGWFTGGLVGVRVGDAIPSGPAGAGARAGYASARRGVPAEWVRAETEPQTGKTRHVRYRASRMDDGRILILASDETEPHERAAACEARAAKAEGERDRLMRYASSDAVALFDKHAPEVHAS